MSTNNNQPITNNVSLCHAHQSFPPRGIQGPVKQGEESSSTETPYTKPSRGYPVREHQGQKEEDERGIC